jgi:uncharacterized protein
VSGEFVLHLTPAATFAALPAGADYLPEAYAQDGFIHCTGEPETLLEVANRFYRDVPGEMVVLVIDPARLRAAVRYEAAIPPRPGAADPPDAGTLLFPHVYGPINREAIVAVRPAKRAPDGTYLSV